MTYYEILSGKDKGKIIRVHRGIGEVKTNDGWEPYNAADVLFCETDSEQLTEEEIAEIEK